MTVPAEASLDVEAALVSPARDDVLDGPGEHVPVVGHSRRKGRPIVERVPGTTQTTALHLTRSLMQCIKYSSNKSPAWEVKA